MITHYNKEKAIPMIISLLKEFGYNITKENIKIWSCISMRMLDVVNGCNRIKTLGSNIIVYTNKVPNIKLLSENEKVIIIDIEQLKDMSLKIKNYELYELLT